MIYFPVHLIGMLSSSASWLNSWFPCRQNCALREPGGELMPLWRTPLLALLVPCATSVPFSRTAAVMWYFESSQASADPMMPPPMISTW